MTHLILGTRGSKLALAQSRLMADALCAAHPDVSVELQIISTKGDRVLDVALSAVGDKGLFVKELEEALLAHEVDFCVHSCKDLPSLIPAGLTLAAFPERADPRDVVVVRAPVAAGQGDQGPVAQRDNTASPPPSLPLSELRHGAIVGTSSLRRSSQLRAVRPDLVLRDVRGNVDTRLRKLAEGHYDAIVLAAAGLDRLGLVGEGDRLTCDGARFVAYRIPTNAMLPAVTQGTLAIECRADDVHVIELLAALDHAPSRATASAERAFLRRLEGGCQVPLAAHATLAGSSLLIRGMVASLDGASVVRDELQGRASAAEDLGTALADALLDQGAEAILSEITATRG